MKTNKNMFRIGTIEKDIQIPKKGIGERSGLWIRRFREMKPGDSFEIIVENTANAKIALNNVRFSACRYRERNDATFKYCTRHIEGNTWRLWRL